MPTAARTENSEETRLFEKAGFLHPKLRDDLAITRQETADGVFYLVKEPITGAFARFGEVEHFIATQLDGDTPLPDIRQRVEDNFGAALPEETLKGFVEKLETLKLLESAETSSAARRAGRVCGSWLHLRFKIVDPDRMFDHLLPAVRPLFTRSFLAISALCLLLALWIGVLHWQEISRETLGLFRPGTLLWAGFVYMAVIVVHEFAHGLTCKHFGGEVREIGALLIYFTPAFYCDVSDAWRFPEKPKRLWVTFAGAWMELFVWALAIFCWRVTRPETWIHSAALVVIATSGLRGLFNLNPLIKLDGYYLLSDWLGIPNLRQRAFGYLAQLRRRRPFGAEPSPSQAQAVGSVRERRVYLIYGLLAGVYSLSLLGWIAWTVGKFLIVQYQAVGLLAFAGILAILLRRPLGRLLWQPAANIVDAGGRSRDGRKTVDRSLRIPYRWLTGLTLIGGLTAILLQVQMELKVIGEFEVVPFEKAEVRTEVEGLLVEVFVEEGDYVSAGEVIARLSDRTLQAESEQLEAETRRQQAILKKLQSGARPEEIEQARAEVATTETTLEQSRNRYAEARRIQAQKLLKAQTAVEQAQTRLDYAVGHRNRCRALFRKGALTEADLQKSEQECSLRDQELAEARAEYQLLEADDLTSFAQAEAVAEKELAEAEARLQVLLAGTRPEEIEAAEAELDRLQARRNDLADRLDRVQVRTPISGTITTRRPSEQVGRFVHPGDLIAEVQHLETVTAEIAVPEKEIGDVRLGQEVWLKARGYPERTFRGEVLSISVTTNADENAPEPQQVRSVRVTTRIDNAKGRLRSGMTGKGKVYCGTQRLLDLALRRMARTVQVEFWSWW